MRSFNRLFGFCAIVFCACVAQRSSAVAQQPVVQSSTVHPAQAHALIVKLSRGAAPITLSDTLVRALHSLSPNTLAQSRRLFPDHPIAGLDRIYLVQLYEGILPSTAASALSVFREIEYAEPNYIFRIASSPPVSNDSLSSAQWYLNTIHAPEAWAISRGDTSVRIGFVDTGVDWLHPDLQHKFAINAKEDINHNGLFDAWPSTEKRLDARGDSVYGDLDGIDEDGDGYVDDVIGYDFVDQGTLNYGDASARDAIPQDEHGHGTSIAGVLAAEQNNRVGISGVAPGCRVVAIRAFDFSGNGEDDDIAAGIVYAADRRLDILSLSFGDVVPSLLQRDAIRYAASVGMLVVASSGNAGGDARHYPSDFDDVLSVGATTSGDLVWQFTQFGEGMDLVAPGDSIVSTWPGNRYQANSGTSYSAPMVAAVAALLKSARPTLSAMELRSILLSTTHDVSFAGYDHIAANGRVDALAALTYRGDAAIKLTSPTTDEGFHVGDTIRITGSAISTLFTGYSLSYALGLDPEHHGSQLNDQSVWKTIVDSDNQVSDNMLGSWDTHGLAPGTYTLRFAVRSSDLRSTEEHISILLASTAPKITNFAIDTIYENEKRALQIRMSTDVQTTCAVQFRPQGSQASWSVKNDDRYIHEHSVIVNSAEATYGTPLEFRCVVRNLARDSAMVTSVATILDEGVSERGFDQKPYTLPAAFVLDTIVSTTQGDYVTTNTLNNLDLGEMRVYRFDGTTHQFVFSDSTADIEIPRGIGATRGDSVQELVAQHGTRTLVYRGNAARPIIGDLVYTSDQLGAFSAAGVADVDGDGKSAIIAVQTDTTVKPPHDVLTALKWDGSTYRVLGTMPNNTLPDPTEQVNTYINDRVAKADLLGTGRTDVVAIDGDADVIAYTRDATVPTGFRAIFTDRNDGQAEGSMIDCGDLDGDGRPDIAFAYHRSFLHGGSSDEYPVNYWTLKVFLNRGGGNFELNTVEHFTPIKDPTTPGGLYNAGLSIVHGVTARNRSSIALSIFPNFYLLDFDSASKRVKPVWHYGLSISQFGAIAFDFDYNYKTEMGFLAGDSIRFFEHTGDWNVNQTATPGGLIATPISPKRVEVAWGAVAGAQSYLVLRADSGATAFDQIASVTTPFYNDTAVTEGKTYFYSVIAIDTTRSVSQSHTAFSVKVYVHATPAIDSIYAMTTALTLRTTEPLSSAALSGGVILIDDSIECSSVIARPDSTLFATPAIPLSVGTHQLRVASRELRDAFNSPFDESQHTFTIAPVVRARDFYLLRWNFVSSATIHLTFNHTPSDEALDVTRYTLTPFGRPIRVTRDNGDSLSLILTLDSTQRLAPIGMAFVLCIDLIHDTQLDPLSPIGNCAGTSLTNADLQHVFVFPNPVHVSAGRVTFGGLTASATIAIYSSNMRFIRSISTVEREGGVVWDLTDETGRPCPTGVYYYTVSGTDNGGSVVTTSAAKFVIVADQ